MGRSLEARRPHAFPKNLRLVSEWEIKQCSSCRVPQYSKQQTRPGDGNGTANFVLIWLHHSAVVFSETLF